MTSLSSTLIVTLVNRYHLKLGNQKVWCPYWIDMPHKGIRGWHGGKGTPDEITKTTNQLSKEQKLNLKPLSPKKIRKFMTSNRLGVDCSGFIYYILDQALIKAQSISLDQIIRAKITKHPFNPPRFRCNADCLTNDINTIPINFPHEKLQPGDLIRIHHGKHVAIVTQLTKFQINYAHSSSKTSTHGVHYGTIKLIRPNQDLSRQQWFEKTPKGNNYSHAYFHPQTGDGPRRLKILAQ